MTHRLGDMSHMGRPPPYHRPRTRGIVCTPSKDSQNAKNTKGDECTLICSLAVSLIVESRSLVQRKQCVFPSAARGKTLWQPSWTLSMPPQGSSLIRGR